MKEPIGKTKIKKRMEDSCKELCKVAHSKTPKNNATLTYTMVGLKLGLTGQTVYNYIHGRGGNGYVIEALIEEFNNL